MKQNNKLGIIVLTSGLKKSFSGKWKLDLPAHMRIAAASVLYSSKKEKGLEPYLILSGGVIEKGSPSLASVMKSYATDKYHIPKNKTLLEDKSVDTTENAEFSLDLAHKKGVNKLIVITSDYQLERARECFSIYNSNPKMYSAEDILTKRSQRYERLVSGFKREPSTIKLSIYNFIWRAILQIMGPEFFRNYIHHKIDSKGRHP